MSHGTDVRTYVRAYVSRGYHQTKIKNSIDHRMRTHVKEVNYRYSVLAGLLSPYYVSVTYCYVTGRNIARSILEG